MTQNTPEGKPDQRLGSTWADKVIKFMILALLVGMTYNYAAHIVNHAYMLIKYGPRSHGGPPTGATHLPFHETGPFGPPPLPEAEVGRCMSADPYTQALCEIFLRCFLTGAVLYVLFQAACSSGILTAWFCQNYKYFIAMGIIICFILHLLDFFFGLFHGTFWSDG